MAQSAAGSVALMTHVDDVVFLFDVDNTLLDNDRIEADLAVHLTKEYGTELRGELGYADYLGALERFRLDKLHDPKVLRMASWLVDYPFADRLYSGALNAISHVRQWGPAVIFSDRCGVPASESRALRALGGFRRPRAHLCP
jgi:beta-phosphoglucomutase-like phosphatase (HAD superfamily)